MTETLAFPWLTAGVLIPLAVSPIVWARDCSGSARRWTVVALALSLVAFAAASLALVLSGGTRLGEAAWAGLAVDALNALPLPLFAGLCLAAAVAAPRRDLTNRDAAGLLWLCSATSLAYAADGGALFAAGLLLSLVPFLVSGVWGAALPLWTKAVPCAGAACAALGLWLLRPGEPASPAALALLAAGAALRHGLLPAHSWVPAAFARGPLVPLTLLASGQLGAFLIARFVLPVLPEAARPWLVGAALATAAYLSILSLAEHGYRRLLGLTASGQSAVLLTGLCSGDPMGFIGAFVLWQTAGISMVVLACVCAGIEARLGPTAEAAPLGLAGAAPRLAVFFLIPALALYGMPLTLGFWAEELLLQGALAAAGYGGLILPAAGALSAFVLLRLFARLFWGRPCPGADGLADALPRERWALTGLLLALLLGGLLPGPFMRLPARIAVEFANVPASFTH